MMQLDAVTVGTQALGLAPGYAVRFRLAQRTRSKPGERRLLFGLPSPLPRINRRLAFRRSVTTASIGPHPP